MTSEKLDSAMQLIEAGNKQAAVPVLREIIKENAGDENAWLLLYDCMDQVEHKKFCLQSVLAINPGNQEARKALDALNRPAAATAVVLPPLEGAASEPMMWYQAEEMDDLAWQSLEPAKADSEKLEWDATEEDQEEIVLQRADPLKLEREKMEWEQTEPDGLEQEKIEREKIERKRVEREKTELERVEKLKMEWERDERVQNEKVVSKEVVREQPQAEPPKIDWDQWDQVEPVSAAAPQKPKRVTTPRRKIRSKQRSLFPVLAGMVLFIMLFTVCLVFLAQILVPGP